MSTTTTDSRLRRIVQKAVCLPPYSEYKQAKLAVRRLSEYTEVTEVAGMDDQVSSFSIRFVSKQTWNDYGELWTWTATLHGCPGRNFIGGRPISGLGLLSGRRAVGSPASATFSRPISTRIHDLIYENFLDFTKRLSQVVVCAIQKEHML